MTWTLWCVLAVGGAGVSFSQHRSCWGTLAEQVVLELGLTAEQDFACWRGGGGRAFQGKGQPWKGCAGVKGD